MSDSVLSSEQTPDQPPVTPLPVPGEQVAAKGGLLPSVPESLKSTFKSVAGIALSGSLLTTGFGLYTSAGFWNDAPLASQFVDTTAMFVSHMAVWSIAMGASAFGWKMGNNFDGAESKLKPRAWAAGVGVALIAASFVFPVGGKIYDGVRNGLNKTFNIATAGNSAQEKAAPLAQVQSGGYVAAAQKDGLKFTL